jgi:hypothetical protein
MSTHTSAVSARNDSATTVGTRHASDVGRLRRQRIQMLVLSVVVATSMAACGNGAATPADPPPMRAAQTGAAVASTKPPPTPTVSKPTHQTLTGPRAYS